MCVPWVECGSAAPGDVGVGLALPLEFLYLCPMGRVRLCRRDLRKGLPFPGVYTFHMEVNRLLTLPPLSASPLANALTSFGFAACSVERLGLSIGLPPSSIFHPARLCLAGPSSLSAPHDLVQVPRSVPGNRKHERMGGAASSKEISTENAMERPSLSTEQRAEPFPRQINTTQQMLHPKCRNSRERLAFRAKGGEGAAFPHKKVGCWFAERQAFPQVRAAEPQVDRLAQSEAVRIGKCRIQENRRASLCASQIR